MRAALASTACPHAIGPGDAMRALVGPLGGLDLPEIERGTARAPPDLAGVNSAAETRAVIGPGRDGSCLAGLSLDRPRVMGVLNVTPDSFSDGGDFRDPQAAIAAGLAMAAAGADIIDVGGESTRPRSQRTAPAEEQSRIVPVIRGLASMGLRVSVDSRNAATMAAALDAGAAIVNDVSALAYDPQAPALVASRGCPVVLMHMRGTPADMHTHARYGDVAAEVAVELAARIAAAESAGIARDRIIIDPGIGFAKTAAQSLELLRRLPELAALGCPILVGVSRKSFLGTITGEREPRQRLPGSLAAGLFALSRGAAILRVHDVPETVQAIRVWQALSVNPSIATAAPVTSRPATEA